MLKRLPKNARVTLSILFIITGLFLIFFNYFDGIKSNIFNEKNIELYEQEIVLSEQVEVTTEDESVDEANKEVTTPSTKETYIGYLSIPDINLKRGFTSLDSEYNSLHYNVMLVDGSSMPDVKNGNLILASHSGSSSIAFFKNLYKLSNGAHAYVTYNGKVYNYKLVNTYDVLKTGTVKISRNGDVNTLTLITCSKTDNSQQLVFIFELQNVTNA